MPPYLCTSEGEGCTAMVYGSALHTIKYFLVDIMSYGDFHKNSANLTIAEYDEYM